MVPERSVQLLIQPAIWAFTLWAVGTNQEDQKMLSWSDFPQALASVLEALRYKPEGRGFETLWGEWIFSVYLILPAALGPGVYSASNTTVCQKEKNNVSGV
jgi:hypothetical protein